MNEKEEYLIKELAEKTNVTVRTIRYYIQEGLLPAPKVKGRYSIYDEDYINRITLIKLLKSVHLPLVEIKKQIETLNNKEVKEFIEKIESNLVPSSKNEPENNLHTTELRESAVDYIEKLLSLHPRSFYDVQNVNYTRKQKSVPSQNVSPNQPSQNVEQSTWQRYQIVDGIELHVEDRVNKVEKDNISKLLDYAKYLFSNQLRRQ